MAQSRWIIFSQTSSLNKISFHCSPWNHMCAWLSPPIFGQICPEFLAGSAGGWLSIHCDWAKRMSHTDATSAGLEVAANSVWGLFSNHVLEPFIYSTNEGPTIGNADVHFCSHIQQLTGSVTLGRLHPCLALSMPHLWHELRMITPWSDSLWILWR